MSVATLAYTTDSRRARVLDPIARVRAAGRIAAERHAAEAARLRARALEDATGQHYASDPWDVDYCYVCGRVTDHTGEHSPDQIARWQAGGSR